MIGYEYIKENNFIWRRHFNTLIPLSPIHTLHNFDSNYAKDLLKNNKSILIRWESNFDNGKPSNWWHIIKDSSEDLMALSRKICSGTILISFGLALVAF